MAFYTRKPFACYFVGDYTDPLELSLGRKVNEVFTLSKVKEIIPAVDGYRVKMLDGFLGGDKDIWVMFYVVNILTLVYLLVEEKDDAK